MTAFSRKRVSGPGVGLARNSLVGEQTANPSNHYALNSGGPL
jgi:hypothetical protein